MGVPMLIQGRTAMQGLPIGCWRRASKICVAYDGMEVFPAEKIIKTGTGATNFDNLDSVVDGAYEYFGFKEYRDLGLGGSLGAATISRSLKERVDRMTDSLPVVVAAISIILMM